MSSVGLDSAQLVPLDWRARLRSRLLLAPLHDPEQSYFGSMPVPQLPALVREQIPSPLQPAAVLVPIVERPQAPTLLLTVRASNLRRHAGQISFPGGLMEAADGDPAAAALRETEEELGIGPQFIEPIGFLADHIVRTGYRITPVVALLQPGFALRPHSAEVADVFELPLGFALAATNYRARRRTLREIELEVWELPYGERTIWGATAGMLAHLREVLAATPQGCA